ncbi:hypothetical protein KSF78_0000342 [Schistosoma japonicum]|nr:hypothetical protein KSF78_0000342 [Schistosoma japonicum]
MNPSLQFLDTASNATVHSIYRTILSVCRFKVMIFYLDIVEERIVVGFTNRVSHPHICMYNCLTQTHKFSAVYFVYLP